MLIACKDAGTHETGGIIVGYYNENLDCAIVIDVSLPPLDSKFGRFLFYRGVNRLQSWLETLWKRKEYYLGEWHFHPFASAKPSLKDKIQMEKIAKSKKYGCPEPVLLVLGGDPQKNWIINAYICDKGKSFIELFPAY